MGCTEEVGFITRKRLKKAETKNEKQISHFKVTFLVRQGQAGITIEKQLIGKHWFTFLVRIKAEGNSLSCQLKLGCYLSLLISVKIR
jgi:hypothetical protein